MPESQSTFGRPRKWLLSAAALAALTIGPLATRVIKDSHKPRLRGTYAVFIGGDMNLMQAQGGYLFVPPAVPSSRSDMAFRITYDKGSGHVQLFRSAGTSLRARWEDYKDRLSEWLDSLRATSGTSSSPTFELAPSPHKAGDWDLVATPDSEAMPGWFLKLDDPRAVEYFALLDKAQMLRSSSLKIGGAVLIDDGAPPKAAGDWGLMLELAQSMAADHPHEIAYEIMLLDALTATRDIAALTAARQAMGHDADGNPVAATLVHHADNAIEAAKLTADGVNLRDYFAAHFGEKDDLNARLAAMPKMLSQKKFAYELSVLGGQQGMNYLAVQTQIKVMATIAIQRMIQGRGTEALDLLEQLYAEIQMIGWHTSLIGQLIAISQKNVLCNAWAIYLLNACESGEEIHDAWTRLARLNASEHDFDARDLYWLENNPLLNHQEVYERYLIAQTRFHLVRMAAAARAHIIETGKLPATAADFAPLLAALPLDPFTSSTAPLRFVANTTNCMVYSVGPDRVDGGGGITYDPTNGTMSAGDVIIAVPLARQYPFSREGLHARDAADIARQFPNGLPLDLFADTRTRPLTIGTSGSLTIYSFGPDADERDRTTAGKLAAPEVMYDPTNGTTSAGDLFIAIPPPRDSR